jgi:hypothetical protein
MSVQLFFILALDILTPIIIPQCIVKCLLVFLVLGNFGYLSGRYSCNYQPVLAKLSGVDKHMP